jgi:nucleoside 2-deoxyribosyltransferase
MDQMIEIQKKLEADRHTVYMPIKVPGVDYWAQDNTGRVQAKRNLNLIAEHMNKIGKSDAILVANYTKGDTINYIGANTFIEMGYTHYLGKPIFVLNPLPDQPYIKDEIETMDCAVIDGDLSKIPATVSIS